MSFRAFSQRWLQILVGGIALFAITMEVLQTTGNTNFVPAAILLGAFTIPATFVTYFYEHVRDRDISMPLLTTCFFVGGLLGLVAAGAIEYGTMNSLTVASLFGVGLIEESVKLIFPLAMFVAWKYRHEADGLLFGVAAGMGFAALETMGYGLNSFMQSRGDLGAVQQVLVTRGLLAPAGHAAWTGFVCAVLWHQREHTGRWLSLASVGAFLLAVVLHGLWDVISSVNANTLLQITFSTIGLLVVVILGLNLVFWRFRKSRNVPGKVTS